MAIIDNQKQHGSPV